MIPWWIHALGLNNLFWTQMHKTVAESMPASWNVTLVKLTKLVCKSLYLGTLQIVNWHRLYNSWLTDNASQHLPANEVICCVHSKTSGGASQMMFDGWIGTSVDLQCCYICSPVKPSQWSEFRNKIIIEAQWSSKARGELLKYTQSKAQCCFVIFNNI